MLLFFPFTNNTCKVLERWGRKSDGTKELDIVEWKSAKSHFLNKYTMSYWRCLLVSSKKLELTTSSVDPGNFLLREIRNGLQWQQGRFNWMWNFNTSRYWCTCGGTSEFLHHRTLIKIIDVERILCITETFKFYFQEMTHLILASIPWKRRMTYRVLVNFCDRR